MERKTNRTHPAYGAHNLAKTNCPQGHPYSEENTYRKVDVFGSVQRHCRTCRKDRDRDRYIRQRKAS